MRESEEYLDILDEEGRATGEVKTREETHQRGLWHRTVHIWVMNTGGELLLQLRAPTVHSDPNRWDISAAGHIPAGEDSLRGALRELREELGVQARAEELEFLFSTKREIELDSITDRAFNDIYLLQRDVDLEKLQLQAEEVAAVRWLPWRELDGLWRRADVVEHEEEYSRLYKILEKRR